MRFRGHLKKFLYGTKPFYRGTFPYFGHAIRFQHGSALFDRVCAEGIYELDTLTLIKSIVRPGTTYLDVGANIGLMAIPVLSSCREVEVISVEASPSTVQLLRETRDMSPFKDRWKLVEAAVGNANGQATFWVSEPGNSALDGLRDTGRGGKKEAITVAAKRLDDIWREAGSPTVSAVKIDVEGGETAALEGAVGLIAKGRPALILEWNSENLKAYDIDPSHIFNICDQFNYRAYSYPALSMINNPLILSAAMAQGEMFLLLAAELDREQALIK